MAREPMIGDVWTKKCFVPPDIRDEVLREILLRTSSQVQTMMMLLDVDNHLSDLEKRDQGGVEGKFKNSEKSQDNLAPRIKNSHRESGNFSCQRQNESQLSFHG